VTSFSEIRPLSTEISHHEKLLLTGGRRTAKYNASAACCWQRHNYTLFICVCLGTLVWLGRRVLIFLLTYLQLYFVAVTVSQCRPYGLRMIDDCSRQTRTDDHFKETQENTSNFLVTCCTGSGRTQTDVHVRTTRNELKRTLLIWLATRTSSSSILAQIIVPSSELTDVTYCSRVLQ